MANNELTAHDAVHMLRLALVQAECAIKGREHTGFITKALVATEHIAAAPAQGGLSDALPDLPSHMYYLNSIPKLEGYTAYQMRAYGLLCRGQQRGVSDAADRLRLNWIENQSDFGPIEITLGKGTRPNTTATYLTYGADDGSRISSGPARHVRAAIDQCKNPDAAIQAQAGDAPMGEKA